jgi:hypothetical protein
MLYVATTVHMKNNCVALSTMRGPLLPPLEGVGQHVLVESGLIDLVCSCSTAVVPNIGVGGGSKISSSSAQVVDVPDLIDAHLRPK